MPARIAAAVPSAPASSRRRSRPRSCAASSTAWRRPSPAPSRRRPLAGRDIDVVHIVGGGSRNALLCQLTADACGRPVRRRAGRGDGDRQRARPGPALDGMIAGSLEALRAVGPRVGGAAAASSRRTAAGPGAETDAGRAVHHLLQRHAVPRTGRAVVRVLERLGHEVDFPAAQTCCGQMHFNTGYRARRSRWSGGSSTCSRATTRSSRRRRRASAMVRATSHAPLAASRRRPGPGGRGRGTSRPRVYELSEFLVDVLGVEDVGAVLPHRVTYHPTCHSLRMLGVGDRPLRLLARRRRDRPGGAARGRGVLRVRRDVRREERGHVDWRWAPTRSRACSRHRRRGADRGRQLVPDAHRRHAVAAAHRPIRVDAPGRDPRRPEAPA